MDLGTFGESRLISVLGWTLLHSLWQIAVVAIGLLVVLRVFRSAPANLRYLVSVAALAICVVLPVFTFVQILPSDNAASFSALSRTSSSDGSSKEFSGAKDLAAIEPAAPGDGVVGGGASNLFGRIFDWISSGLPRILPAAVVVWMLGVAFFSLRLVGGFLQLQRYGREANSSVDAAWQKIFFRLCCTIAVRQKVAILRSTLVRTPIAIGVFKPMIIIPASLFLQITPRELETIIAHELIHIRRYDPLVNVIQCVIETLFFYHPAVWWISTRIRREREFAADAAVLEVFEDSHVTYARALANLEEIRLRTNNTTPRYATAANGGNFMQRIQRILKIKTEASMANSAWTAGLAFLLTSAFLLTIFSFSSSDVVNGQERASKKKIAVGFVSIPPLDRTDNAPKDGDATARLLIQKLKEYKIPAVGFLQGGMVSDGERLLPVRANIARLWIDAGFEVGIGGFKHMSLYETPVDEYIANVEKNERVAKQLIGDAGQPLRYFSYPFLNTGKSVEDKAKFEAWLASRGYTSLKYTFDNQEWQYTFAYDMARNDNDVNTMKEIRGLYLDYMTQMLDHYEAYSTEMFGRDIPQTMVLTPSRLITDTFDEFFGMLVKRGYKFVTVDEAQSDAAYKTPESFSGKGGISWFERWSFAKGSKLRNEPEVDQSIQKTWNEKRYTWNKK